MTRVLDLSDIQGHVIRAYGRYSFPHARFFFLRILDAAAGRRFVEALRPLVTTGAPWPEKPKVTVNVAFSFYGLHALGLPARTLQAMPFEFIEGMRARAHILGDRDPTRTEGDQAAWDAAWDPIWRENDPLRGEPVHVWVGFNAQGIPGTDRPVPELEARCGWLRDLCAELGQKVRIIARNGAGGADEYQPATAIFRTLPDGSRVPTPLEHFGFADGIGDPVFEGQMPAAEMRERVVGRGKWMGRKTGWQPLATGEFVLGHVDEAQELPPTAPPASFMRNGTFMAYRKLHQNVGAWRRYMADQARLFARVMGVPQAEAQVTLAAKIVGRWPDGIPLAKAGSFAAWRAERARLGFDDPATGADAQIRYLRSPEASDFRYAADMQGFDAPGGCHLRRVNTRDYLDPLNDPAGENPDATSQLNKRRRILRRGLPYGAPDLDAGDDATEQGVAMMALCASLFRQFEFIQQQWIAYGLDFNQGNLTCPLTGDHRTHDRFVIPSRPDSGQPPFLMTRLPNFVETRGGEYFFLPSLTALRMIGMGTVDPT
jgi:deferrochelatase/peroxidase EfeB